MNKVPRWVFRYVGNKTFDFSSKKKDFLPKNDQIWPKIGIFGQFGPGHAGLFSALLVGRLVVVARGLYLARHLFTLYIYVKHLEFKGMLKHILSKKIAVQRKHLFENYKSEAAVINFSQLSRIIFTSLLFIGCNEQKAAVCKLMGGLCRP